jgi:excisionase family DNA binding protein
MAIEAQYLKASEVATILQLDISTVYKMCSDRVIPSIRVGEKAVRIPKAALEAYLVKESGAGRPQPSLLDATRAAGDSGEAGRALEQAIVGFHERVGSSAHDFVERWRAGEIADTSETASLLVEALSLRDALDRVGELVPA